MNSKTKLVSIRIRESNIDDLKFIARANGIPYQTLVKEALERFVVRELRAIVLDSSARRQQEIQNAGLVLSPTESD